MKAENIQAARDPQREHLAQAIADRQERSRAVDEAKVSVQRAALMADDAEAKHAIAKASLASWRNDQVARVLATASTGVALTPEKSAREAREVAADAQDSLDAAKAALAACTAHEADCVADLKHAQRIVADNVDRLLLVAADQLMADAADLRAQLDAKYAALRWIEPLATFGSPERQKLTAATPAPPPPGVRAPEYPTPTAWVEARQALLVDADAALPS